VEQRLDSLGERIEEQFAQVDQRFAQVDQRFAQVDQRFAQVDQRFEQVDQRFEQVDQRFGSLEAEVRKLRVLGEQNATDIKRIAEVQTHHGEVLAEHGAALQRIEKALEPLTVLPAVIHKVLPDHERRITALEQARPPDPRMP
jgi:DNA repair exonuclease SbcCD ATPase subunit